MHPFGYSRPHLSSICYYLQYLLANDFGLLWGLGICAAHGRIDSRERSSQALEIDFFQLGRESRGLVYPECSLRGGRAWNLSIYVPLTQRFLFPGRKVLPS